MYTSKQRLDHGVKHELGFEKLFTSFDGIQCEPFGQVLLPDSAREVLRNVKIHVDSDLGKELINTLPEDWRHIYKRGIGDYLPSLSRWDPDYILHENKEPIAFVEVKSSIVPTGNVSIEMSGLLAALVNSKRLGLLQIYAFSPCEEKDFWSYTTLEKLMEIACRPNDGSKTRGSNRPFVLIPKREIVCNLESVFVDHETTSTF